MTDNRPRYPIGVQSFEKLRRGNYVYVDKTRYIPQLIQNDYFFMSRPRRFGKSLFLSTLEAYFLGKKELFEGLDIYDREKDWEVHPVIRVDFSSMQGTSTEDLAKDLKNSLKKTASFYGIGLDFGTTTLSGGFGLLIERLHDKYGKGVVVLIDEYDKGIIEMLHDRQLLSHATEILRPFFSVLKSHDQYLRFTFLTGVSRFRNTTLFSGANNLLDISLDARFASLMGFSHEEVRTYFHEGISSLARGYGYTHGKTLEVMKDKYDGYRFTRCEEYVYNPFSLICALSSGQLDDFWIASGTSKILATYLRESGFQIEELTQRWVSASTLGSTYSTDDPLSLFFQTGYLTIRDFDGEEYRLGIPNQEVQKAMVELLIPEFTSGNTKKSISHTQSQLRRAISEGDIDTMMEVLRRLLSSVPYHEIDINMQEKHLHLCMYIVFMMLGVNTKCEIASSGGRVDMVAQTPWRVYVFEFKLDGTPAEALAQIDDREYALQWEGNGREVIKIGVNFSSATRTIESWDYIPKSK